jgi:hypothetical protein
MQKRPIQNVAVARNLAFALLTGMTQVACIVDRSGLGISDSEFLATPANICPSDPINLSWNIWSTEPCWAGRPVIDTPHCSTVNSPGSDNPSFPFNPGVDDRSGSIDYDPGPSTDTTFSMIALITTRRGTVRDELASNVNVIEAPSSISTTATGLCADNAGIALEPVFSACVEIDRICVSSSNPTSGSYFLSGWRECAPGTPPDVCARATFRSDALSAGECITPGDVGLRNFQGLKLVDIDWRQDPIGVPRPRPNCAVEGSGYHPDLIVTFDTSCSNAYPGCED